MAMRALTVVVFTIALAACGSSTTKTATFDRIETVSGPAQTVTQVVHSAKPRVIVRNHTQTVTVTQTVHVPVRAPTGGGAGRSFSGNGTKNLGTIKVHVPSTLHWSNTGGGQFIIDGGIGPNEETITIGSSASHGDSALDPGTYPDVNVLADGNWTITIKPQ